MRHQAQAFTSALSLVLLLAVTGCSGSDEGGGIDLGEPKAGADDELASAACDEVPTEGEPIDAAANPTDAPSINVGTVYEIRPVPAGTSFVSLTIPSSPFQGAVFVMPGETVDSALQIGATGPLSPPAPNGHCRAVDMSDYRVSTTSGDPIVLELDGDSNLWLLAIEGGSMADGG
ncbi:MAG: hypothetical protein R3A78_10535 [Polyangiales bacterium]|nr:hypothetical protein [Myxococcales bacterium]